MKTNNYHTERQHQHTSGGNKQQADAILTVSTSGENRPLLYKQGSYNTWTRQVDDTPVSEEILKF
jgi:hypothetical protein